MKRSLPHLQDVVLAIAARFDLLTWLMTMMTTFGTPAPAGRRRRTSRHIRRLQPALVDDDGDNLVLYVDVWRVLLQLQDDDGELAAVDDDKVDDSLAGVADWVSWPAWQ